MSPVIAYSMRMAFYAMLYAGLAGQGIARVTIFGASIETIAPVGLGLTGLFLIGVRMWRDDKLVKRETAVSYEEGYLRGIRDAQAPGPVPTAEAMEHIAELHPEREDGR